MWLVTGPRVAEELLKWITWVEILKEIITDQASNFTSSVLQSLSNGSNLTPVYNSISPPNEWGGRVI